MRNWQNQEAKLTRIRTAILPMLIAAGLNGCVTDRAGQPTLVADLLMTNGTVYVGDDTKPITADIAVRGEDIVFVGKANSRKIAASRTIDAQGLIVAPGFIDPHTHGLADLKSDDAARRANTHYRTQGVTTIFTGNDGGGNPAVAVLNDKLTKLGIGINTATFVGHGAVRRQVMQNAKREPTASELERMKSLVGGAMDAGAIGLSTGLFYAPGSFAKTSEVVALAKVAGAKGGVYDSHIRDESTYNLGVEGAISEALEIGRDAKIPVHIAHIKALGVDVWGKSTSIIKLIEDAQKTGLAVTADQYPWVASGTGIANALIPNWMKAGGRKKLLERLDDPKLTQRIRSDVAENLRRRGGSDAVLITQDKHDWKGRTLTQLAAQHKISAIDMAIKIVHMGDAKIASFNMNEDDIANFMRRPWVMTGSDGGTGHPRKYASFPRKYETYVRGKKLMTVGEFIYRSSGLTAKTFGLCDRGFLRPGLKADIVVFHPDNFRAKADFQNPAVLSEGVEYLIVNGKLAIEKGVSQPVMPGKVLRRCE